MDDFDFDFGSYKSGPELDEIDVNADEFSFDFGSYKEGGASLSDYSKIRAGLSSFAEAALGIGDEADAVFRMMFDGMSYEEAIEAARGDMRQFEAENENLSTAIDVAGFAAGFLVPGAALAKAGQGLSKAQMIKRGAAVGAAEGAAYGFLSGEEEGRLTGLGIGAAGGGALGGLATKFLTKSADEIAAIDAREAARAAKAKADDSYIWGEEGLGEVKAAVAGRGVSSSKLETSAKQRNRKRLEAGSSEEELGFFGSLGKSLSETAGKIGDGINYATRGTADRLVQSTGNKRVGMLVKDVELLSQRSDSTIDETFEMFSDVDRIFRDNPILQREYINLGQRLPGQKGKGAERYDYSTLRAAAKTPDEKKAVDELIATVEDARNMDLPGYVRENDWAPSLFKGKDAKNAKAGDYESPFVAAKNYAKDVQQSRILAQVFDVTPEELAKIKPTRLKDGGLKSRVDSVIDVIEKKAAKQAGETKKTKKGKTKREKTADSAQAAANLADALRSTLVHSKAGASAAGALARKVTSTGLLANWSNAALNIVEGITLPIYQSGMKAWAKTVPDMLWATANKGKSEAKPSWISTKEFGQDKQFMGEVTAQAEDGVGEMVDKVGSFFYKWTGVQRVNDMGAEGVANTAITFARDMAKDGSPTALKRLRNHAAAEGMNSAEFNRLVRDLKSGAPRSEAIENFAGRAMLAVQPRGASVMPQLYNDMPNGRVFYSMLSYMNRMYNVIRNDIGRELADVQKYGINTERGQAAFKRASVAGVKFSALLGLANGVWDDTRKALFDGEKREDLLSGEIRGADLGLDDEFLGFLMETTGNQLASLGSSGFANIRSKEYGGGTFDITPAPVQMGQKLAGGLFDVITEQDPTQLLRFGQSYVPGVSQLDKGRRMATGDRLFQEIAYDD